MALFLKPLDDPYGYDAYRLLRSKVVPSGLAVVVLGCALGSFAILLPHLREDDAHAIATEVSELLSSVSGGVLSMSVADNNAGISLVMAIFFVIGLSLLGYARNNRKNYMTAYPRIKNFYTPSQKAQALKLRRRWMCAGVAGLMLSAIVGVAVALAERTAGMSTVGSHWLAIPLGIALIGTAPSLWMIAHGVIVGDRVDIFEYNYQALSLTNRYDIRANQTGERQRVMLGEQRIFSRFRVVNRCIMSVGVFCTVALWVVPSLRTRFALVPLIVACILWYAVYKLGEQIAKHRYEQPDPDTDAVSEAIV